MKKIIIGCDPDSNKSGIAIYKDGLLGMLECKSLVDIFHEFNFYSDNSECELHIENVNGISSNAFHVKSRDSLPVKLKKAEHVGKCKQAQIEIERMAEHFGIKVVHHRVSKQWKKNKEQFELNTGWIGRSNEDTRSAAWFGFIGCN